MKKVALFSLMVCLGFIGNVFAEGCSPNTTTAYAYNQAPDHDEFLYRTETDYKTAYSGWKNTNHLTAGSATVYECDDRGGAGFSGCGAGAIVDMPAGHVWKGQVVNKAVSYQCYTTDGGNNFYSLIGNRYFAGDDQWVPVAEGTCETQWGDLRIGYVFNDKTEIDCSGLEMTESNRGLVKKWRVSCKEGPRLVCEPQECVDDYTVKNGRCEETVQCKNIGDVLLRRTNCKSSVFQRKGFADVITGDLCSIVCVRDKDTDKLLPGIGIETCPYGTTGVMFGDDFFAKYKTPTPFPYYKKCTDGGATDPNQSGDCEPGKEKATKNISIIGSCTGNECVPIVAGRCYKTDFLKCMEAVDRKEAANWNGKTCNCGDKQKWDKKTYSCTTKGKTCEELHPNASAERLACCRAGNATTWSGSETSGTCSCTKGKEWTYTQGARTGQCVDKNVSVVPGEDSDCYYTFNVDINCSNGTKYTAGERVKLTKEQAAQFGGCDATTARIQSVEDIIEKTQKEYKAAANLMLLICGSSSASVQPNGPSATELSDATSTLESFVSRASSEASVWKDADGNFNTARLASDLTAGVVLGTVGGVVSGVVIKKKQVEKGFDALHCTVGGQKVADWGDTFNVGLQR